MQFGFSYHSDSWEDRKNRSPKELRTLDELLDIIKNENHSVTVFYDKTCDEFGLIANDERKQ